MLERVDGISCQHLQEMVTNWLQKHWEWQEERNPVMKHGTEERPTMFLASLDINTAFDEARREHVAKILDDHNTHGWIIAALLREMLGLSRKAMSECVESSFAFNRCLRQGSVEAPRLWQKMATQILAHEEEEWMKQRTEVHMDINEGEGGEHQICGFMWADNFWIMSHSKKQLEQMLKDVMKKRLEWIWSPSLQACGGRVHTLLKKRRIWFGVRPKRLLRFPFENEFRILGCMMNRQGKTCGAVEDVAHILDSHHAHECLIAAHCRGWKATPCLNAWKAALVSTDACGKGAWKLHEIDRKWPPKSWPLWRNNGCGKEMEIPHGHRRRRTSNLQLYVGRQLLEHITLQRKFGTDATRSCWRSKQMGPGTQTGKSMVDKYVWFRRTKWHEFGRHIRMLHFSFCRKFKVLGCAMNRQKKTYDAVEELMQSANKNFWEDIFIYKSKDVSWKIKCQRLVDHVCAVFVFGSENWSWTIQTLERIKGWETKRKILLFRFKRHKDEMWVAYHTRTC